MESIAQTLIRAAHCRNAQAASILASVGGGSCGSTSSRFYVESSVTAVNALASAASASSAAQACDDLHLHISQTPSCHS